MPRVSKRLSTTSKRSSNGIRSLGDGRRVANARPPAGESPGGAVHGVTQCFLPRIVKHVKVHIVHDVGEAEPRVRIGEAKRVPGTRRAEGAPARAPIEVRSRSEETERHPAGNTHHLVPRTPH